MPSRPRQRYCRAGHWYIDYGTGHLCSNISNPSPEQSGIRADADGYAITKGDVLAVWWYLTVEKSVAVGRVSAHGAWRIARELNPSIEADYVWGKELAKSYGLWVSRPLRHEDVTSVLAPLIPMPERVRLITVEAPANRLSDVVELPALVPFTTLEWGCLVPIGPIAVGRVDP